MRSLWLVVGALLVLGCRSPIFPVPYPASAMAADGRGVALLHYLRQPGASATPCDRRSNGPRFLADDPTQLAVITEAMIDGELDPTIWRRCTALQLQSVPPGTAAVILDAMLEGYESLLDDGDLETEVALQERLEALHATTLLRPREAVIRGDEGRARIERIRLLREAGDLGKFGRKHADELLVSVDLERGLFEGHALTEADLDRLAERDDRAMLRQIVARVPDENLAHEARRRIVRIHIARSTYPEVREHPAEVEALVLAEGRNPIESDVVKPTSAWLDESQVKVSGVLVRQYLRDQTVHLFAFREGAAGKDVSVIPTIKLRGSLFLRVPGIGQPITLCAPPEALDVAPCLLPEDLRPRVPVVYVDDQGLLHFVEKLTIDDAQKLVFATTELPLPFAVAGHDVLTIEWPIRFERPEPLIFDAPPEQRGPDLWVDVKRRYSNRLLFMVVQGGYRWSGVVEESDLGGFLIASRGGAGRPGAAGQAGSAGSDGAAGTSASCPSSQGGNGGNGTAGGPGGQGSPGTRGGDGGNVEVQVSCATGDCAPVLAEVAKIVQSLGGSGGQGGAGGPGGRGGRGGNGGSGTSCYDSTTKSTTYLSAGMRGSDGATGAAGSPGANGADGKPGQQMIREVAAP